MAEEEVEGRVCGHWVTLQCVLQGVTPQVELSYRTYPLMDTLARPVGMGPSSLCRSVEDPTSTSPLQCTERP